MDPRVSTRIPSHHEERLHSRDAALQGSRGLLFVIHCKDLRLLPKESFGLTRLARNLVAAKCANFRRQYAPVHNVTWPKGAMKLHTHFTTDPVFQFEF